MKDHSILMVDDIEFNHKLAHSVLDELYDLREAYSVKEALEKLKEETPSLILLDVVMPENDGFELLRILKETEEYKTIPVIFLTGDTSPEVEIEGFKKGIVDCITKPFVPEIMKRRIATHIALSDYEHDLEAMVAKKIEEIEQMYDLISSSFAGLVESRDGITGGHLKNTAIYFEAFIKHLMTIPKYSDVLTPTMVKKAIRSAPLHDVGKIAIEDAVLRKDSSLNGTEFERMKQHSVIGGDLFLHITDGITDKEFGRVAEQIARYHHEKWDGSGYPEGLKGKQIPLVARIMSIVDVYDALTSERSYKKPYSHQKSMDIIASGRGTNFDPELVDEFVKYEKEIKYCLKSKAEFNEKKYFRSRT